MKSQHRKVVIERHPIHKVHFVSFIRKRITYLGLRAIQPSRGLGEPLFEGTNGGEVLIQFFAVLYPNTLLQQSRIRPNRIENADQERILPPPLPAVICMEG